MASNFTPMEGAMGLQDPADHHPSGHDLNWLSNPPSSSFSLYDHQRRMHGIGGGGAGGGHVNLTQLLDDSGSNSDNMDNRPSPPMEMPGFLRNYLPPTRRRLMEDGSEQDPRRWS